MTTDQTTANSQPQRRLPLGIPGMVCLTFLGVILPAVTLILELLTRMCAGALFDPVPTVYHGLLIAYVPLANLAVIIALRRQRADYLRLLGLLNGASIGIAGFYSVLFLPLSPFAVFLVVFGGIGLLPLSPLSSMISAIILRRRMKRLLPEPEAGRGRTISGLWPGIILALAALIVLEVPKTVTIIGLQMATAEEPDLRARGLKLLRTAGNRDVLLRACYVRQGLMNDPLSFLIREFGRRVTEEEVRIIYYRVTGTPFNAVKPPHLRTFRGSWIFEDWDPNVGGDAVQGRIRSLSLNESRLDTVIEAGSATAYTEWTMVFKNVSPRQQEARALIMLPPGGVVSRLTLWIDGEEREAAFGGRSQVKEAYKKVVQRRRDPVLVTTCGPDRVLVQCFPVPPSGGIMKIRFGITLPLALDTLNVGLLRLPYFTENNFNLPETGEHGVWLESDGKLTAADSITGWVAEQTPEKAFALRGTFKASVLDKPMAVKVERPAASTECRAKDTRNPEPRIIRQIIKETRALTPQRVVMVIDGSRRMGDNRNALAAIVSALPKGLEFGILLASDEVKELAPIQPVTAEALDQFVERVNTTTFSYGCDNVRALSRAWDMVGSVTNSAILWLHAAQPVDLGGLEPLRQKWERRPGNPALLCAQFGTGPNVVVQGLDKISAVRSIMRSGDTAADVRHLLELWSGTAKTFQMERIVEKITELTAEPSASFHVVRLWAQDEIQRLSASSRDEDRARALQLARLYQLITPVSGAVVLETQQQYQEAGLEPVSSQSVPTIPEPEIWLLLATGAVVLLVLFYCRRRAAFLKMSCG